MVCGRAGERPQALHACVQACTQARQGQVGKQRQWKQKSPSLPPTLKRSRRTRWHAPLREWPPPPLAHLCPHGQAVNGDGGALGHWDGLAPDPALPRNHAHACLPGRRGRPAAAGSHLPEGGLVGGQHFEVSGSRCAACCERTNAEKVYSRPRSKTASVCTGAASDVPAPSGSGSVWAPHRQPLQLPTHVQRCHQCLQRKPPLARSALLPLQACTGADRSRRVGRLVSRGPELHRSAQQFGLSQRQTDPAAILTQPTRVNPPNPPNPPGSCTTHPGCSGVVMGT